MLPAPQIQKKPASPQRLASRKAMGSLFAGLAVALGIIGTLLQVLYWWFPKSDDHTVAGIIGSFFIAPFAARIAATCWRKDGIRGSTWGRSIVILLINAACLAFLEHNMDYLWGAVCPGPVLCLLIEHHLQAGLKPPKKKTN
jgi:hypothetical protein